METPVPVTAKATDVVVLCGSTRFPVELAEAERALTLAGHVVFGLAPFVDLTDDDLSVLVEVHLQKIDLADRVVVVAPGGYVGESTRSEIEYAERHGKLIEYRTEPAGYHSGSPGRQG